MMTTASEWIINAACILLVSLLAFAAFSIWRMRLLREAARRRKAAATPTTPTHPADLTYDPEGRLVRYSDDNNATSTTFVYDGTNVIAEYNGTGTTVLRHYVFGPGTDEPIVWYEGSGVANRHYLVENYQGSIIATLDSGFNLENTYEYGPYGEPEINRVQNSGNNYGWGAISTTPRFRYTGQMALNTSRLYYYKARIYDPIYGHFLQTDPIGTKDDLNLYAYTGDDPVNGSDSTGMIADLRERDQGCNIDCSDDPNTDCNAEVFCDQFIGGGLGGGAPPVPPAQRSPYPNTMPSKVTPGNPAVWPDVKSTDGTTAGSNGPVDAMAGIPNLLQGLADAVDFPTSPLYNSRQAFKNSQYNPSIQHEAYNGGTSIGQKYDDALHTEFVKFPTYGPAGFTDQTLFKFVGPDNNRSWTIDGVNYYNLKQHPLNFSRVKKHMGILSLWYIF